MIKYLFFLFFIVFVSVNTSYSQSYNDGPIEIQVKLREVGNYFDGDDWAVFGTNQNSETEDFTYKLWFSDNLNLQPWIGYGPLGNPIEGPDNIINTPDDEPYTDDITQVSISGTNSQDFNSIVSVLDYTTSVVPEFLKMKFFAWEDDDPSDPFTALNWAGVSINNSGYRNVFESAYCQFAPWWLFGACAPLAFQGDDYGCEADPFFSGLNWRYTPIQTQIPPCTFYSHGEITGSGCVNNSNNSPAPNTDTYYRPIIETFWKYTKGTSFINSINLGSLSSVALQHFNSNECYNNYYTSSPGNDVIYSFDILSPTGVNISLCGLNGAQFDSYLYLVDGNDTTTSIASNDNSCSGIQSQIIESLCNIGTYYVVVDASAVSEFGTFTIEISEDPGSTFSVVDSISDYNGENISCNSGSDGKFYAHVSGGTSPYTYAWTGPNGFISTTNYDSLTGLSSGNYSVIVTDFLGCELPPLSVTITDPDLITVSTISTPASCAGYSNGAISVTNTSGGISNLPFSYSWTPTSQTGTSATSLLAGVYTLLVTDVNGCSISHQQTVTEPGPPSMNITASSVPVNNNPLTFDVCEGSNITLTASPGLVSYSWSPNIWLNTNSGSTVISTPTSPGVTYTCTGTDVSGCTVDIQTVVNVVSSVNIYASNPTPQVCEGEDITITWYGASGTTYSWFPPTYLNTTFGSTVTITPEDTITYTITVQDASGCTDEIQFFVDTFSAPNINATPLTPSICYGSAVPITASGANSYSWSPNNSLNNNIGSVVTASPLTTTQYKIIGTALNGCKDSVYTTISVNSLPVLNVTGTNSICEGESTSLLVNSASIITSYIWTPSTSLDTAAGNIVSADPSTSQTYNIVGIDLNQCEGNTSYTVSVLPTPNVSITASKDTICISSSSILTANGALSYNWTPLSSLNTNIGFSVTASPTTITTYSVLGTSANNCTGTDTVSVYVNPLPILTVSPNSTTICDGDSVNLSVFGAQDYLWSPALGLNTTVGSSVFAKPNVTTNYLVEGMDINGCSDVISTLVNVNPIPIVSLSPSSADICNGASVNITAFGANNYTWYPALGLNTSSGNSVNANPNTSITYSVEGTDNNNCSSTSIFQLNVGINPSVSVSPPNPIICEGDNIVLSVEGADQYVWFPSQSLSSSIGSAVSASPLSSTLYTVIGTDSLGCIDSVQTTISVNPKPIADLTINDDILICTNDSAMIIVELSGVPPWEISYAVNNTLYNQINTFSNPSIIYGNIEGDYTIPLVVDGNNCSNIGDSSVEVIRVTTPVADFDLTPQPADVLNSEITFLNNSIFSDSWIWDFGDGYMDNSNFNTSHIFSDAGNYKVTLVVFNDICSDTIVHPLIIDPVYTIYVPDAFSPNNDGINDIFIPKGQSIDEFEMYIYNRWGEEVFYTKNINIGWDGQNANNSEIVVSTYTYIINITDELGVFHTLKGKIFLN